MSSILIAYGTGEGQTAKVADHLARRLEGRGHAVDVVDVAGVREGLDLTPYDGVLVGASVHLGKHQERVKRFVRDHVEALASRPAAFFQVCLSSAVDDEERRAEAEGYLAEFTADTGWEPARRASFGGALRYSAYGFLKRGMMRRIAREATGDVDTARDYEYTDWTAVEAFADEVAGFVEAAAPEAAA